MTTNQLRITRFAGRPPTRMLASVAALPLLLASAAAAGVIAVSHPEWYRGTLAIALTVNLIIVAMKWPRAAAVATLLLLPFLALVRRLLIADAGFVSNDPLLLVGPVVALFVLYRIYVVEGRRSDDRLFKLVAALLVVAVVQVFNPLALGGLLAAAGGLLFVGVPLLWFFVGRELGDRVSVTMLLYGTIVVGCIVAVYGLLQTQYGTITSWDQAWVDINGYSALQVSDSETGSVLRPFSTFSSNQEYAAFLSIAFTFVVALLLRRRPLVVLALPLLGLALFLAGGRGSLVLSAIAGIVLLALMTRNWLAGLLVVFLGVAVAYGAASTFGAQIDRAAGIGGDAVVERNVTRDPQAAGPRQVDGHRALGQHPRRLRRGLHEPGGSGHGRDEHRDEPDGHGEQGQGERPLQHVRQPRARRRPALRRDHRAAVSHGLSPLRPPPRRALAGRRGPARRDVRPVAQRRPVRRRAAAVVPRGMGDAARRRMTTTPAAPRRRSILRGAGARAGVR